jgi:peptide/nickel transport system substrate-binding protein
MRKLFSGIAGSILALAMLNAMPAAAENVVRWASVGGARTLDPHAYDDPQSRAQFTQVYEPLVGLDSNLEVVPQLATAWRLVTPTVWEFDLRPDVRFHDGTPLTAADVVFSFMRAKTKLPMGLAVRLESIAAVSAPDERTVRIETKFPDPQLWAEVLVIYIMPERWATAHDARVPVNVGANEENYATRHENGTGPFLVKEFEPDGRVVMVRNLDWWGRERYPHNIDRIEFTPIADPQERLTALLRGDLDLLTDPPLVALDRISSTPGLKLTQAPELRTVWLGLDQGRAELRSSNIKGKNPFKDKRVREAMYRAIDIETIRRDIMRGLAVPAGMLVAPGAIGFAPELDKRLPYDPETAKRLLAAAGYADGFSVTLNCPNNSNIVNDEAICRTIAAQLDRVGIAVTANPLPKEVAWAKIDNRESDFWLDNWGTIDSQLIFDSVYRTGGHQNATGYSNPRADALIKKVGSEIITYGRDAMIEDVWKIVLDDIVYIPLHHQITVWALRNNLDVPVFSFARPLFREARLR